MNRSTFILHSDADRTRAIGAVRVAEAGGRVEVKGAQRNLDQNAAMWAALTDVAAAKPGGRDLTTDQWKVLFLHAWGREVEFLPALDGRTVVPYGHQSSSELSRAEMSSLLDFIHAWGAENGVIFSCSERVAA